MSRPDSRSSPAPTSAPGEQLVGPGRALLSCAAALVCIAAVVALARYCVGTASGQRLDQLILSGAQKHEGLLSAGAELAVQSVSIPVVGALLAATVLLVLLRRRLSLLFPLGVLVIGANLTTQVLKHLVITREALGPGIEITPNSFPSGHTTLAASAMIALVLASGRARVLLAPLGALWTLAAGTGTLVVGWHRPSDVVGAVLVTAVWTFLVLAADGLHTRRRLRRTAAREPSAGRAGSARAGAPWWELAVAAALCLVGMAGLGAGAGGLTALELPIVLEDSGQQLAAFDAMTALIGGGTAAWLALVLLLRTPSPR